jgi:hypothetical protein
MWKILIPLLLLLAVIFIQLRRVEAFTDPACARKPGAYSVRCTDGAVLDPQGTVVPSTCGYKPNITGVVTDPNGGICGSVPAGCKGWAFNGAGVWTNFNLVSNTSTSTNRLGVGNRGTGGLSVGGYTGSYLGNVGYNPSGISAQLGNLWGGYSGTRPTFGTTGATTGTTGTGATGTAATTGTTGTTRTILPPTTNATRRDASGNTVDASGNAVTTRGTGTINLSLADLITLFGSTATGTSAPPAATPPSNNPAPSTTAGQDFYNQFRPMLLEDINKAIEAKATVAPVTVPVPVPMNLEDDASCSPSLQQGTDFSTAQNNIQYNQEYIRKDSIPCYACSL